MSLTGLLYDKCVKGVEAKQNTGIFASVMEKARFTNKNPKCKNLPDINKKKYLVPLDLTVGQFIFVIRRRLKLDAAKAIFLFVNNQIIPPSNASLGELYEEYKSEDGFLYMTYSGENTFG